MSEKLKPCPWCGKTPRAKDWVQTELGGRILWTVGCWDGKHLANTGTYKTKRGAIAAWNRRKGEKP